MFPTVRESIRRHRSSTSKVDLSRHLLDSDRVAKGAMDTSKPAERTHVTKQVDDPWTSLSRRGDHDEQLSARLQLRQNGFEVRTERVQFGARQEPMVKRRLAEAAQ